MYQQDQFYHTGKLIMGVKREIIRDAMLHQFEWWVDTLDCSVSCARQRNDMSLKQVMTFFNRKSFFFAIHRKGFDYEAQKGEVGFRTSGNGIEYFLWIHLPVDDLIVILKKYGLEPAG